MDVDGDYGCKVDERPGPRLGAAPARQQHPTQPVPPPLHSPLSATSPARLPLPPLSLKPLSRSISNPIITTSNAKRAPLVPRAPLRKGKWTPEEEVYAHYIIDNFNKGLISLTRGTPYAPRAREGCVWMRCHSLLPFLPLSFTRSPDSLCVGLLHSPPLPAHLSLLRLMSGSVQLRPCPIKSGALNPHSLPPSLPSSPLP
jgi:hypothetical protein